MARRVTDGADPRAVLRRAEYALQAGKADAAESLAREAIRLSPQDGLGYYLLGRALAARKRYRDALEAAREARRCSPDDLRLRWLVPKCLVDLGRLREAEREVADLVASAPDRATTWSVAALLHLKRRDYRAAEAAAREWLRLQPESPRAHGVLGLALFHQGRAREALAAAGDGLRLDPQDLESLAVRLECALAQRRFREARELAREMIRLAPTSLVVERAYARCVGWSWRPFRPLAWWTFSVGRWPRPLRAAATLGCLVCIGGIAEHVSAAAAGVLDLGFGLAMVYLLLAAPLFRLAVRRGWFL